MHLVRKRIHRLTRFFEDGLRVVIIKQQRGFRSYNCVRTAHRLNYGYTLAPRLYLCPRYFDTDAMTDLDRARALIHEMTHRVFQPGAIAAALGGAVGAAVVAQTVTNAAAVFSGSGSMSAVTSFIAFGHPVIGTTRVTGDRMLADARRLADRRPVAARRSPVNWANLFMEIGTGVQRRT
jgi:hypothetical protein